MKINVETKFNVGDFVRHKTERKSTATKMLIVAIGIDFEGKIACCCEWLEYHKASRITICEDSLELWEGT
jgi:hypothetical protein